MSDYSLSYSFNTTTPPREEPLYALDECEELALPQGQVVLLNKHNGAQLTVTRDVSIALQFCSDFRSLEDHARHLVAKMPELGGNVADVTRVLASIRDAGLMCSADAICAPLEAQSQSSELAPSRVFILTCDRPQAVERLLHSMNDHSDLTQHEGLYLIDNSREPHNADQNRQLLADLSSRLAIETNYVGRDEQESLLQQLEAAVPESRDSLRFLLDSQQWRSQPSYGLSRNWCLLLSAGKRCLMLDDDILCEGHKAPLASAGLAFSEGAREAAFFSDTQLQEQLASPVQDPLVQHLGALGGTIQGAASALANRSIMGSDLTGYSIASARRLAANSRVLSTESSTLGDHGSANNFWMLQLEGDSLQRLAQSGDSALGSRKGWVGCSRPTFAPRPVISQLTGLDNSALLPPYFPAFRGEDILFGWMLSYLHPHSVALQLDCSVPHLPLEERDTALSPRPPGGPLGLLTRYLEQTSKTAGGDIQTRLLKLSLSFQALAEVEPEALIAAYRSLSAAALGDIISILSEQLQAVGSQAGSLGERLEAARTEAFQGLQALTPPQALENDSERQELRRWAQGFAGALQHWPRIRGAAQSLLTNHDH